MTKDRITTIIALLICAALAVSLVSVTISYSNALNQKESEITSLTSTIAQDNATITNLQNKATSDNTTINSLTSQTTTLQDQMDDYKAIINMSKASKLKTLIFHVSEKGQGYTWGHIPNVSYTYNQIMKLNNGKYDIQLLPEYEGNNNWTKTATWLKQNFANIPITLSVFEGGSGNSPTVQLTTDQISEIVTTCNVQELRIAEIASWHIDHNVAFPTDYLASILTFARTHDLKVEWSEWKVSNGVFQKIQTYITGYEDIVTVNFQTNSEELQPADGMIFISNLFQHYGGSIQSWYWATRELGTEFNMPTSLLVQHALAAKNTGAEILQFEPYWYFFDNGEPNENLKTLMTMLT